MTLKLLNLVENMCYDDDMKIRFMKVDIWQDISRTMGIFFENCEISNAIYAVF